MSGFNFNLDPESFGLGLLAGWGAAYAARRTREFMKSRRTSDVRQLRRAYELGVPGADVRYVTDLMKFIQADHLAGRQVALGDILVEPRFLKAPALAEPEEENMVQDVFHVVPTVHDFPYLHAPYNLPTLSLEELDNGDRALALLGIPGSGRTTALHAIALWSLGQVDFIPPKDTIQQQLEEDESQIENVEERARRYSERVEVEELAREAATKGQTPSEAEQARAAAEAEPRKADEAPEDSQETSFRDLTPFYVHLTNVTLGINEYGTQVDPAEPLLRALQRYVGTLISKIMPRPFYERLAQGKALLLIDGFDEVPDARRPAVVDWLRAFIKQYRGNFIIVTGPARGYGDLQHVGLTPVFMRPWSDNQVARLADHWATHWQNIQGGRRAAEVPEDTVSLFKRRSRALSPFELTVKLWAMYTSPENTELASWMDNLLTQYAPASQSETLRPALEAIARLEIEHGVVSPSRLDAVLYPPESTGDDSSDDSLDLDELEDLEVEMTAEPSAATQTTSSNAEDDLDDLLNTLDDEVIESEGKTSSTGSSDESTSGEDTISKETREVLTSLVKNGLLRQTASGYRTFHPLIAAYNVHPYAATLSVDALLQRATHPRWREALVFAAHHIDLGELVQAHLDEKPDVGYTVLLDTARWLRYTRGKVDWMPEVLRQAGRIFAASTQYPLVRERVAAALVGTRQRGAVRVFERAIKHPDPQVRTLSCLGMGALRAGDAVATLSNMLEDEEHDVVLAAGLALGALGTEDALEEMAIGITEGEESLRQAIAEALAAIPDDGYSVLYDAVSHDDMLTRRAAVFGLRRVPSPWALVTIYRTSMEDPEWYVRSAAELAFLEMRAGDTARGPQRYPEVESIPWLTDWFEEMGKSVAMHKGPGTMLRKALEEGAADVQTLSVINMGQLGLYDQVDALYKVLRHREPDIRDAAYRALGNFQTQLDAPLPAPTS